MLVRLLPPIGLGICSTDSSTLWIISWINSLFEGARLGAINRPLVIDCQDLPVPRAGFKVGIGVSVVQYQITSYYTLLNV
jgi:hypothetical protein